MSDNLQKELVIYQTPNFTLEFHPQPFVSRQDGGHLRIFPKDKNIEDRTQLLVSQAVEFMRLSMLAGEALQLAMNDRGIPVVKINYEELGNWAFKRNERPVMHLHIFGRAENASKHVFPEAVYLPDRSSGFYDGFEPLNKEDVSKIREHIEELVKSEKYSLELWSVK